MKLRDVIIGSGEYGVPASAQEYKHGNPKYLRITDITDDGFYNPNPLVTFDFESYNNYEKYKLNYGDMVFARTGNSTGRNYLYNPIDGDLYYAGFLIKYTINSEVILPEFLALYCKSSKYWSWIEQVSSDGSTRKKMNAQNYLDMPIPNIPLDKQKYIVDNIIPLENKYKNNNLLISKLDKYLQLIYYKWFIDFNFPDDKGREYRKNKGKLINVKGKDIPEGWGYEAIGNGKLSKLITSGVTEFKDYKNYIATSEIQKNNIISKGEQVTFKNRPSRANMQPRVNSVWFAKMQDSVKHIFISKNENYLVDNYIFSTGMSGLQCNDLSFYYISCIINSEKFERKKDRLCTGSTQKAINNNGIKSIKILRPSDSVLEKFNKEVGSMIEKIELLKHENKLLEETRDLLIKKLIK